MSFQSSHMEMTTKKKGELKSMLVKLQTVQEVQKTLLIEDKRHPNMNVESSRVNFSLLLGLICGHSTFTMKRSIDLLNNGKNGNQLLFSVCSQYRSI